MKRFGKVVLSIFHWTASLLGLVAMPSDIRHAVDLFLHIPLWVLIFTANGIGTIGIFWWIWHDTGKAPIIAGGYRLRRLAPLVLELLRTKELASSEGTSVGIMHFSLASELTKKLNELRIEHPDLHSTHRFGDAMDDEYLKFTLVLLFLEVLRRNCLAGDLRGARAIMSRIKRNGAGNPRYPL